MSTKEGNWFKRHKILTVIAALILIAIIANTANSNNPSETANTTNSTETNASAETAATAIGQPARDGKFEFVVSGIDCSKTQLGNQYISDTAQGVFCIVDVSVTNIGNEAQYLFADNQYAFNASGQKFSADSGAAIYLDDSSKAIWDEINPGNKLTGKIVFDVPAGTQLTSLELHDSALSSGIKVNLQ